MLRIIIDGSADMPAGWDHDYQLDILPIPIQIGGKTYYQGHDITPELFYELISNKENKISTAAPSPYMIQQFISKVTNQGDSVLSISVSGKLSATASMVQQAAEALKRKFEMHTFDSWAGSAVLAFMAREARLRDRAGDSIQNILEHMQKIREKFIVVLTIDDLDFARQSGRVGALKAALTSLLNIKPIISVKNGEMVVSEMVRTRRKSLDRLVSKVIKRFGNTQINVAIVHSQDRSTANTLREMIGKALNTAEIIITELSISVVANLGPKTVGIVAMPSGI
jgi:DegV family protein with EDD domain